MSGETSASQATGRHGGPFTPPREEDGAAATTGLPHNDSSASLASLDASPSVEDPSLHAAARALVAPAKPMGSPPRMGSWEARMFELGSNVSGVFARRRGGEAPSPQRTISPSASLSPISLTLRARAKRTPDQRWTTSTRGGDDAGLERPPLPFGMVRPVKAQKPKPSPLAQGVTTAETVREEAENHSPGGSRKN